MKLEYNKKRMNEEFSVRDDSTLDAAIADAFINNGWVRCGEYYDLLYIDIDLEIPRKIANEIVASYCAKAPGGWHVVNTSRIAEDNCYRFMLAC